MSYHERQRSRSRSRSPPSRNEQHYNNSSSSYRNATYPLANNPNSTATTTGMISTMLQQQQSQDNDNNLLPPGVAPVPNLMLAAQEKINRELFVGNTPPNTSELLLAQFLNGAMRRVGLCAPNDSPIIHCRVNSKFAFVECTSIETANKALNLNGIPFMGSCLKVSRPSKYVGPHLSGIQTWQQLTGQPVPPNVSPLVESSAEDKINRELFVGNTTPEMTEHMIIDFLGKAMEQVGLSKSPGNPIVACRLSGKFAFVELRTIAEACAALNLNNIPYMGTQLRVGRPSKYTGLHTPHGNWEDILSKYLSGELKVPLENSAAPPSDTASTIQNSSSTQQQQSKVVELRNMLTTEDLQNDTEYDEILEDTKEECGSFGALKQVIIPRDGPGSTKIFLEYFSSDDAAKAISALRGKTFDGRKVEADYFDEDKFVNCDYS